MSKETCESCEYRDAKFILAWNWDKRLSVCESCRNIILDKFKDDKILISEIIDFGLTREEEKLLPWLDVLSFRPMPKELQKTLKSMVKKGAVIYQKIDGIAYYKKVSKKWE